MTTASPAPAGLTVRTITEQELELFFALPLDYDDGALRAPTTLDSFTTEWRRGSRRPGWTWLALRHGRPVARAAWWAPSESAHPAILDIFDLGAEPDRLAVGEALLRACWREAGSDGARDLEYELFLPPGWRGDPAAREPAERRLEVARRAGLAVLVERLRYQWFPAAGLPPRGNRLRLRPLAEVGEGAFLDALARTYSGSLDAHTRQELDRGVPPEQIARDDLALLRQLPGPSEGWRCQAATTTATSSPTSGWSPSSAATATPASCSPRPPPSWPSRAPPASAPTPTSPTPRWPPPSSAPATTSSPSASTWWRAR